MAEGYRDVKTDEAWWDRAWDLFVTYLKAPWQKTGGRGEGSGVVELMRALIATVWYIPIYFVIALLIVLGLLIFADPAQSQQRTPCGTEQQVLGKITAPPFEEQPVSRMANTGGIIYTYVNLETGTWTILLYRTDGIVCMLGAGGNYEVLEVEPPGEPT